MNQRLHSGNHNFGVDIRGAKNTAEAIVMAGLDWEVEECELTGGDYKAEGVKGLFRSTDGKFLSVVSDGYKPLQNVSGFKFFDPIVEKGLATLETAGQTKDGKSIFVLAKLNGACSTVLKNDPVDGYVLLSNAHDKTRATRVQFTNIRVVCTNILDVMYSRSFNGTDANMRVQHRGDVDGNLLAIQKVVDFANQNFTASIEQYKALTKKALPDLKGYVREVLGTPETELEAPRAYDVIERIYHIGPGQDIAGVKGTYWGAYNAVTHWIDNYRGKNDANKRLDSTLFGTGRVVRERALEIALN